MEAIIRTKDLTKTFNSREAVSGLNMTVNKGEIYGFLGPNGAGKTTVMKLLTNLIKPSFGSIELFEQPLTASSYAVFRRMGCLIELPVFYEKLSARSNLELHGSYMGSYDSRLIDEALEQVGLQNTGKQSVRSFSLGMKQRLAIARAIMTRPELLILDEPINGLDPAGIKDMRSLLRHLNENEGITILISSHMLSEIEQIADTIGVINRGRLIKQVALSDIREERTAYIEVITPNRTRACAVLADQVGLTNFKVTGEQTIRIYDAEATQTAIARALALHEVELEFIGKKQSPLEDYFLDLIRASEVQMV